MKRIFCLTLCVLLAFSLCACACSNSNSISLNIADIIGDSSATASTDGTYVDRSAGGNGDNSATQPTFDTVESTTDINQIPTKFVDKLVALTSYKAVTAGQTVSNVFGLEVVQAIDCVLIKDGEKSYFNTKSESSLVKTSLISYFFNGNVNYKYKDADYTKADLITYLNKFGVYPVGRFIEGFKVSAETVRSVEKVASETNYCFKITFDNDNSADAVKVQAKEFGGLNDYPTFSLIELTVTMDNCFSPIKVELTTEYKAKLIIETECKQHYVVNYTDVNGTVTIPDEQNFDNLK